MANCWQALLPVFEASVHLLRLLGLLLLVVLLGRPATSIIINVHHQLAAVRPRAPLTRPQSYCSARQPAAVVGTWNWLVCWFAGPLGCWVCWADGPNFGIARLWPWQLE